MPQVVLFPHAVLPLHIFEPRYRQMTEDALADGDKLVTIVLLRPPGTLDARGRPEIEDVACLGRILRYHRLPDGRFNFLLLGLKRVRLGREFVSDKLYRLAEAEVLEDLEGHGADEPRGPELVARFRKVLGGRGALDPDLGAVLDAAPPLGVLTDLVAHALEIPAEVKQGLLAEPDVERRADRLLQILGEALVRETGSPPRHFPPPFSTN